MSHIDNELQIKIEHLTSLLSEERLSIFHSRDEIKDVLGKYLEIGSLDEARDYILPRLGFLTKQEANRLLSVIHDEMLEEGQIANVCRETTSSRKR